MDDLLWNTHSDRPWADCKSRGVSSHLSKFVCGCSEAVCCGNDAYLLYCVGSFFLIVHVERTPHRGYRWLLQTAQPFQLVCQACAVSSPGAIIMLHFMLEWKEMSSELILKQTTKTNNKHMLNRKTPNRLAWAQASALHAQWLFFNDFQILKILKTEFEDFEKILSRSLDVSIPFVLMAIHRDRLHGAQICYEFPCDSINYPTLSQKQTMCCWWILKNASELEAKVIILITITITITTTTVTAIWTFCYDDFSYSKYSRNNGSNDSSLYSLWILKIVEKQLFYTNVAEVSVLPRES